MTYSFSVINDFLECSNSKRIIVSDSVNKHIAHFTLDSTWNGYNKTATFTNTKTKVSVMIPLDVDNNCYIPFEPLENDGQLDVCLKGNLGTTTFYTYMEVPLTILKSGKTDASTPLPPTQSVYDELMGIAMDKYVNALVGNKTILITDWNTTSDIFPITSIGTPIIITGTTQTLRTGTFTDYLDRISYPFEDFYMDYSTNGIDTTRVQATSESGASPTLRRIYFTVNSNAYEMRITSNSITMRRSSGSTNYYIHQVFLRFDDYFYYDFEIEGFTTKHQAWLYLEDTSHDFIKGISFKRYPFISDGYIRLNFSQKPMGDLHVTYRALKTDKELIYAVWTNTEGDIIYSDIMPEPISDLTTVYDNYIPTVGQIKEYITSKLV